MVYFSMDVKHTMLTYIKNRLEKLKIFSSPPPHTLGALLLVIILVKLLLKSYLILMIAFSSFSLSYSFVLVILILTLFPDKGL